jgi:hypothetical protein
MQVAFEKVTGISGPAIEYNSGFYYVVQQEPYPDVPLSKHCHYHAPKSQRQLGELELFRGFKDKLEQGFWVTDWTNVY